MSGVALRLEQSVEAEVSLSFAWQVRTDVASWNDPPATFLLDGPFATGSRGTTVFPGQEPVHWRIVHVRPYESFALETQLDRATLTCEWRFERTSDRRTRLTQTIVLTGENAAAYAGQIEAAFGPHLAKGMDRIAAELAIAARRSKCAEG